MAHDPALKRRATVRRPSGTLSSFARLDSRGRLSPRGSWHCRTSAGARAYIYSFTSTSFRSSSDTLKNSLGFRAIMLARKTSGNWPMRVL